MNSATAERMRDVIDHIYVSGTTEEQTIRMRELVRLEKTTCLVRSLESAFGVPATLDELRIRAEDLDELTSDSKIIPPQTDTQKVALRKKLIRQMDSKRIERFIERVSTHETPLGQALKAHIFTQTSLTSDQIDIFLRNGSTLLLSLDPPEGSHIAHVQNIDGNIVRVSDEEEIVILESNQDYDGILVTPK